MVLVAVKADAHWWRTRSYGAIARQKYSTLTNEIFTKFAITAISQHTRDRNTTKVAHDWKQIAYAQILQIHSTLLPDMGSKMYRLFEESLQARGPQGERR
jgi:hypothetical protein